MPSEDHDFPYKLFGKRLAWSLGFVPLLNVPVRVPREHVERAERIGGDVTDADVLGYRFAADGAVSCFLADCRNTATMSAERVFWVKGLGALLNADHLYLLKRRVPANARWLASQLGITVGDKDAIDDLSQRLRLEELRGPYFDGEGQRAMVRANEGLPRESPYGRVLYFLRHTLWTLPANQRVQSVLDLLNHDDVHRTYNPRDRLHQSIVLLAAAQLGIALALVLSRIGAFDLAHLEQRLREELHGGRAVWDERVKFTRHLTGDSRPGAAERELDLPSFPHLVETANRLVTKRFAINDAIRCLDVLRAYHAVGAPLTDAARYVRSPVARKFARDILGLFVRANKLDAEFLELGSGVAPMGDSNEEPLTPAPAVIGPAAPSTPSEAPAQATLPNIGPTAALAEDPAGVSPEKSASAEGRPAE